VLLVRIFIGAVVGAAVVATAFMIAGPADGQEDWVAEPTTAAEILSPLTTTTTEAPWVVEGEIRFESTVMVPSTLSVEDGVARLEYELATLGPTLVGDEFEDSTLVPVQPEHWLLVSRAGNFEAETVAGRTYVGFDVPDEVTLSDVVEVRLVGWRTVMPVEHLFEVPLAVGEHIVLPDGASMTVRSILEQASGTLASFDTRRSDDSFAAGPVEQFLEPVAGAGWRIGWPETGFQVVNDNAPTAPDSVWLRYTQSMWIPVNGDIVVWEGRES
jgi:hypothetical protein